MNIFGKNNNKVDDYTLVPELVPDISVKKWYNQTNVKVGCIVTIICILSIFGIIFIFL